MDRILEAVNHTTQDKNLKIYKCDYVIQIDFCRAKKAIIGVQTENVCIIYFWQMAKI